MIYGYMEFIIKTAGIQDSKANKPIAQKVFLSQIGGN